MHLCHLQMQPLLDNLWDFDSSCANGIKRPAKLNFPRFYYSSAYVLSVFCDFLTASKRLALAVLQVAVIVVVVVVVVVVTL